MVGPRRASKAFDRRRRWRSLWTDPAYVEDWHAHAGPLVLEAPPFRFRRQTEEDLAAGRWNLLAWEAPRLERFGVPFWADVAMYEGRAVDAGGHDQRTLLHAVVQCGATFWGLRLRDGGLVLRLNGRRGRVAQIHLEDGNAFDPERSGLELARGGTHSTRWTRLNDLDGPVFPHGPQHRP